MRIVQQKYKPLICSPGTPAWSMAQIHAYNEIRLERRDGMPILMRDIDARAAEIVVIPKMPVVILPLPTVIIPRLP